MNRPLIRLSASAGAAVLALLLVAPPAGAQQYPVTVTGQAVCSTAGTTGTYTLNWTVTNGDGLDLNITGATQSGAATGTVTIAPNPIPSNSSGTGSSGPIAGSTSGTVTLTVDWTAGAIGQGTTGTTTGTIQLAGTCVVPSTTSTSTSTTTTSTTIRPVAVSPRFTG